MHLVFVRNGVSRLHLGGDAISGYFEVVDAFNTVLHSEHVFGLGQPIHVLHSSDGLFFGGGATVLGDDDAQAVGGIFIMQVLAQRFVVEAVHRNPFSAFNGSFHFLLIVLVSAPGLVGLHGEEAEVAVQQGRVGSGIVIDVEVFVQQTFMVQLVEPTIGFLGAGQHFMQTAVGEPIFFGDLREVDESIGETNHVVQGVGFVQVKVHGDGAGAAQASFLSGLQVSGEGFDVGGLFHVEGLQPVSTDEVTNVGNGQTTGGQEPLFLGAVAIAILLAELEQIIAQEGLQVGAVFFQQSVQLIQTIEFDVLVDQVAVVGHAQVGSGAAAQLGGEHFAFSPAGNGNEDQLDLVGITEVFLSIAQLPAIFQIEASDGAVIGFHAQFHPAFVGESGQSQAQHHDQSQNQSQSLFHGFSLLFLFYRISCGKNLD